MNLPKTKQKPKQSMSDFTMLAHGPSKIGKTEFCAQIPDGLFLATEAGHNHVEAYVHPIHNWDEFLAACAEIAGGKHPFKCVIIDTVSNLFQFCSEAVCAKNKIQHESDLSYGKGHALVRNEFTRAITKLSMLDIGLVMITHSAPVEIETRTGKRTRIVPTLPDKIRQFLTGMSDVILFCDMQPVQDGKDGTKLERVMHTKPSPDFDAGDRTGKLPAVLPLNYPVFVKAFQNAVRPTPEPQTKKG